MNNKYTSKELNIMKSTLYDGMPVDELHSLLFPRKKTAIVKKVQYFGYGVKTIDGIQYFYSGLKSRTRRTKAEIGEVSSEKVRSAGKNKNATNISAPTKSERTNQNISDDIVTNNSTDITKNEFISIYDEITSLFSNSKFHTLQSISIATSSETITVVKNFKA